MSTESDRARSAGLFTAAIAMPFWFLMWGPQPAQAGLALSPQQRAVLDAILMVESSGMANPPDGDGGKAIGPYQIHEIYWRDAIEARPELGGTYQDCRNKAYAEQVIAAYMERWAGTAWAEGDAEVVARIHNGGPRGHEKAATDGYWSRVVRHLDDRP